ncbi:MULTISPECIES: peptidase M42 [unclassified Oceanobacter]|uniref:peptidase M42 n=1 Tax=unclassified Oceanobacter TaxID=2620260 RepID=UPI002733DA17|nr:MULTISPECIES: peptidase M42 [unclassified Oceanobacter]MDP2609429.1 peptidase M42 [Oceanobacter sp. 1_MG-2023]MDP2612871.1 peptidase M42 [Oceanobacter sp. 2_MG-2023]
MISPASLTGLSSVAASSASVSLPAPLLDIIKSLIRSPSVVGAEHSFFRVLQRELEDRGARVTWYEGLLVAQGNKPDSLMFSAHIDRHGLICTGPNEFQYAAFVCGGRSDLLGNSVSEELMLQIVDRFVNEGVFAYDPWSGAYRGQGTIRNAYICPYRNNLIFELDGMSHLVAGTPVAFQDRLRIAQGRLYGQLDNVLTAAMLVYLFELGFCGTAFFTAQEEAGRSWRYLLEWFRRFGGTTNQLVVVDTSPYPDIAAASQQQLVLRHKDANAGFNHELTQALVSGCEQLGLSYRFKDDYIEQQNRQLAAAGLAAKSLGSTEMGRIVAASGGLVDGTTLQIPTTGYHTMNESAELGSGLAFVRLLCKLAGLSLP